MRDDVKRRAAAFGESVLMETPLAQPPSCGHPSEDPMSERTEKRESPQRRWKCACPSWTTARECMHLRHAPDDAELHSGGWDGCECACHEEYDDDE